MKRFISILIIVFAFMASGSMGYAQTKNKSDFLFTYSYVENNQKYVYVIYKFEVLNRSNGKIEEEYRLMLISSDLISYSNCNFDGLVTNSNGAFFVNRSYYGGQMDFGVIYNDTYYLIGYSSEADLFGDIKSAKFFPDTMSISFMNEKNVKKTIKLSSLPDENKIKVKSIFY